MVTKYKGYTITVIRGKSLSGDYFLYYSIFRDFDDYECTSGYLDSDNTVKDMSNYLKNRVDVELLDADPWGELLEL